MERYNMNIEQGKYLVALIDLLGVAEKLKNPKTS
jgi:hypothetical protein